MEVKGGNKQGVAAEIATRATMGVKVRRAQPDGSFSEWEDLGTQSDQVIQLTYEQAVEVFGQEQADLLFQQAADALEQKEEASD